MNIRAPARMSWEELDSFVRQELDTHDFRLDLLREYPFTESVAAIFLKSQITLIVAESLDKLDGFYLPREKDKKYRIFLNAKLREYNRDLTLFQELGHAWYHFVANYDFPDSNSSFIGRDFINGVIIEWQARQWRATPPLLRTVVRTLGLEEQVYDQASYDAFVKPEEDMGQLYFSFYSQCPVRDLGVNLGMNMDGTGSDKI